MRITKANLRARVEHINKFYPVTIDIDCAYGGYRVTNADGSVEYSPRLTARECYYWLHGFMAFQSADIDKG